MEKDNLSGLFKYNQRAFGPFLLSLEDIRPHLLNPNLTDVEMVGLIREMSVKFTRRRDHINDYVLDADHVSAYAALYLPTNIPKLHFVLSKLGDNVLNDLQDRPFIDVGAGPGTFSLGWKMIMQGKGEVLAIDQSTRMLDQAQKIMQGFFPSENFHVSRKINETIRDSVMFFGHSINEMGTQRALELIISVDPEYVIWIEPGTSELFLELKKLRSFMLDSYEVIYPCPSSAACPSSWCHQVLRMSHDPSVERLSQLVSLDRKILPMTAHVYRRKKWPLVTHSPTLIRYVNETKFSFEYEACLQEDGKNVIHLVEIPKKQLDKATEKIFKNLNVGERINFEVDKKLEKKIRIKLRP